MLTQWHPRSADSPAGFSTGTARTASRDGIVPGLIVVFTFFAILGGTVFVGAPAASWLSIASEVGIIALPVGLLMIAGELDISVGSVIPASSLTAAIVSGYLACLIRRHRGRTWGRSRCRLRQRRARHANHDPVADHHDRHDVRRNGPDAGLHGADRRQHRCVSRPRPAHEARLRPVLGGMFR